MASFIILLVMLLCPTPPVDDDLARFVCLFVCLIVVSTANIFRNEENALAKLYQERAIAACEEFTKELNKAKDSIPIALVFGILTFNKSVREPKSEEMIKSWQNLESEYPGLRYINTVKAADVLSRINDVTGKSETWWRVHIWGPIMDCLLCNIAEIDDHREKSSVASTADGRAKRKFSDMNLRSKLSVPGIDNPISFLNVEEKPAGAAFSNQSIREIPLSMWL